MYLVEAVNLWARRALSISALDQLDVWDAFEVRNEVALALAQGAALTEHLSAMLATADDLWHDARATVQPLLELGTYLQTRTAEHYARLYLADAPLE